MKHGWFAIRLALAGGVFLAGAPPARAAADGTSGFVLRDFLGRTWRNECVRFRVNKASGRLAQSGRALVGPEGRAVPYQVIPGASGSPARIAFLADLDPFETRAYRFTDAADPTKTDLKVERGPDRIRITNARTGLSIARRLVSTAGPIHAVRTASGSWVGDSRLAGEPPRKYEAEVVADGPVFVEVVCKTDFGEGRAWSLRFRMQAGEPVILADESFSCGEGVSWTLGLGHGFGPTEVLYRYGKSGAGGRCGKTATWKIAPGGSEPAFVLEPWLRWWERLRQGNWFGLRGANGSDLLAVGALNASVWVDPPTEATGGKAADRCPPRLLLTREKGELALRLPLTAGRRRWMIAVLDAEACLAPIRQGKPYQAPLPQQLLIKHGDFPLDRVKDYVLDWVGDRGGYPRLFVTQEDLARLRRSFRADPKLLARYRKAPISPHSLAGPVTYYLATRDEALGLLLGETAVQWVQKAVDQYLRQDRLVTLGFAPHHQTEVLTSIILADAVLAGDVLSPELRRRIKAQIAFLGYTVSRPDYWSPERGFGANPNMTTTVAAFQCAAACAVGSHPMARAWARAALAELKDNQLDRWSDADGGWLEAPHYAMVSYDYLVGCFLMARNAGFADCLYDERMKKVIEWFAKISTPPDSRLGGLRHLPCIGNTYVCEPTGEFGILAGLWKDRDPRFAAEMQWMHRQHGSRKTPGIGGFFPTLAGYRGLLSDESISPRAPAYKSEWFRRTGVVLRNAYPSNRETYLHMIAGQNHDHYDRDSGSIVLYGKGRALANDFGYYGYVTGEDHNMVVSAAAPDSAVMHVKDFVPADTMDYVRGVKQAWTRQVLFVKDANALGPNYFVLRDSLRPPAEGMWRLYCTADNVAAKGAHVRATGKEDVDMDLFFAGPATPDVNTKAISRSSWGLNSAVRYGRVTTTQTGVVVALPAGQDVLAVLYPRLKSEKAPAVTALAGGKGVRVRTDSRTDFVFLTREPAAFSEAGVVFEGTAGAATVRGKTVTLTLGAAGVLSAAGKTLRADRPATKHWPR